MFQSNHKTLSILYFHILNLKQLPYYNKGVVYYYSNNSKIKPKINISIVTGIHIGKYKNKYHQLLVITEIITGNIIVKPTTINIDITIHHNKKFFIFSKI